MSELLKFLSTAFAHPLNNSTKVNDLQIYHVCGFHMLKDIRGSLNHTCSKTLGIHRFPSEALVNKNPHKIHQYNFNFKVFPEYSTELHSSLPTLWE